VRIVPDGSRRVLLGLLLGALFIRIGWWALYAGIIENEGVEYARLASNWFHGRGYVSAFGGTHTLFPPLYPLLIGLATPLAGSEAAAARLVSVLAGVLLVWALARLGTECFNPLTGMIAGVLGAVHPLLVALSASTYSESLYLSLITVATLLAFRSVTRADWRLAACTGALIGAAYLTRPEGIVLAGPMAVIVAAGMWRKGPWIAVRQAAILGITVCLVAAPYIVWLSHLAGRFRWEGKSGMNNLIVSRVRSGLTFCQASRGLDSTGRPVGPYLIKDQSQLLKSEAASAGRLLEELTRSPIQRARTLATHVRYAEYLSVPIILLLVAIGLLFTRWWREQPAGGALLLMVPAVAVVVLLTLEWIWQRFVRSPPGRPYLGSGGAWADRVRIPRRDHPARHDGRRDGRPARYEGA
jgi:4-amino-4-deoxy-L-arabinose transferase-like glycosyltransferase